ncbi:hypothetical protein QC763_110210 [Podospora pseudopauciseta]|uniref:Uncharacterized protein n=4 Tax=Podospora TaxID=5144 RepID=A0A090CE33_PODAN|nr:hypothetical protein QC761_110210 [Podospora bellae-mahoneyi]KAK4673250.1 hypothetical protein QC763_110210 [Podospora pseudopauciseta]KAK4681753.1 hypothetical protein QC764_110210 [Podospora pseudoanserina]CDP23377.1 Putative protein of unknown function [Podospora anserina S mat+]
MATTSRILTRALPALRMMSTTAVRRDAAVAGAVPLPARKPVGALRGGLFGFFFGSTLAGAGVYYYAVQEYKASNELLTEDIYTLQRSVERLSEYITAMEQKMELLEKKKR